MQDSNSDLVQVVAQGSKGHIYIVEDNANIRSMMVSVLQHYGFIVETYEEAETFLTFAQIVSPAVILLDMSLPSMSGVDAYDHFKRSGRSTPVIYISGNSEPEEIIKAMKLGAKDFFIKPAPIDQLIPAIREALQYDAYQLANAERQSLLQDRWNLLTEREKEICRLILDGMGNSEIARKLDLMPDTVKKHRSRVMEKLQARSLSSLLSLYRNFQPIDGLKQDE